MNSKVLSKKLGFNFGIYRLWSKARYSTQDVVKAEEIDITSADETPKYQETLTAEEEYELMKMRNKSNLRRADRNRIKGLKPYDESKLWIHDTVRFKQRTLGRYGIEALDVPVGSVWPSKEEIDDKIEYEKTAYPHTIQECWQIIEQRNQEKEDKIQKREMLVAKNMTKIEQWEKELHAKIYKKEQDMLAAKERKERLVEEVRRHFGFKIDPRDERFKTMMEQKEKEDKKRKKEAKKQERSAKIMAQLMEQANAGKPNAKVENKSAENKS